MYVCNICGSAAYFDGRLGDGPILTCGCKRLFSGPLITDTRCGTVTYSANAMGAAPVESDGVLDPDLVWANESRFSPKSGI